MDGSAKRKESGNPMRNGREKLLKCSNKEIKFQVSNPIAIPEQRAQMRIFRLNASMVIQ
jgi:hypothetical protein